MFRSVRLLTFWSEAPREYACSEVLSSVMDPPSMPMPPEPTEVTVLSVIVIVAPRPVETEADCAVEIAAPVTETVEFDLAYTAPDPVPAVSMTVPAPIEIVLPFSAINACELLPVVLMSVAPWI